MYSTFTVHRQYAGEVVAEEEEDVVDLGVVVTAAPGDRNAADVKGCASRCNALRRVTTYLL